MNEQSVDRRRKYDPGLIIMKLREGFTENSLRNEEEALESRVVDSTIDAISLDDVAQVKTRLGVINGLLMLALFERAGRIKHVTPLVDQSRSVEVIASQNNLLVMALRTNNLPRFIEDPLAGMIVVEFYRDNDVQLILRALERDPNVEDVSRVPAGYVSQSPPLSATPPDRRAWYSWNLHRIEWARARSSAKFKDATGIRVAVLDSGVDRYHPDLAHSVKAYQYNLSTAVPINGMDRAGHGTHVTGIIGAKANVFTGTSGICSCDLRVWKVSRDVPTVLPHMWLAYYMIDLRLVIEALKACLTQQVQVINASFGFEELDMASKALYKRLISSGTIIVAAMGNDPDGGFSRLYPAAAGDVIAVGATDLIDNAALFSTAGDYIALCSPGVAIPSTLPTYDGETGFHLTRTPTGRRQGKPIRRSRYYATLDGTSMAAPHVTAAVALLLAKGGSHRSWNATSVRRALQASADPVAGMKGASWHNRYGAGRLNIERLLR